MNEPIPKPADTAKTEVFPQTLHRVRLRPGETAPGGKPEKRANTQTRDTRENRGARQMKTSHNPQTFPHGK